MRARVIQDWNGLISATIDFIEFEKLERFDEDIG